eukprot:6177837-Pleurochrysis_carterae.AAC.3
MASSTAASRLASFAAFTSAAFVIGRLGLRCLQPLDLLGRLHLLRLGLRSFPGRRLRCFSLLCRQRLPGLLGHPLGLRLCCCQLLFLEWYQPVRYKLAPQPHGTGGHLQCILLDQCLAHSLVHFLRLGLKYGNLCIQHMLLLPQNPSASSVSDDSSPSKPTRLPHQKVQQQREQRQPLRRRDRNVRCVFQFGVGASESLLEDGLLVCGRFEGRLQLLLIQQLHVLLLNVITMVRIDNYQL